LGGNRFLPRNVVTMKPEAVMPALRARGLYPKLIARLGISRQAIDSWRLVPADRVVVVAAISGLKPHVIRPDIFPNAAGKTVALNGPRTLIAQRRQQRRRRAVRRVHRRKANGKGRNERREPRADQTGV
jgi:hypothetical protein